MLSHLLTIDVASFSDTAVAMLKGLGWFAIPGDGCECLYHN